MADEIMYNDPAGGTPSEIGSQIRTDFYQKKALIEAAKQTFFGQLADVTAMPKNMGKKIKKYHYLPLLDDANINDQGIDAAGATTAREVTIEVTGGNVTAQPGVGAKRLFVGNGVSDAAALEAAQLAVITWIEQSVAAGGLGSVLTTKVSTAADYVEYTTTGGTFTTGSSAYDQGYRFNALPGVPGAGNLYGSSKDVGTITAKLPALSETGGRVNRVGFKRVELEGTIEKFGFFDEYTQESLDFDTDAELMMHINREMVLAANEMTEDALQIDLLNAAGVVRFGGTATQDSEISGESGAATVIDYNDLMRLSIDLDNNRCPKNTKLIAGSRMVDTRVIDAARYMYIGSELIPMIKKMTDNFGNQAFIPVQQYASAGNLAVGEIGTVDQFRIIVVPEMMHWEGAGATESNNAGYRATGGKYDVFPMLVVGSESFTTIGFQTDGKQVKFKITHKAPGKETADRNDPYGEVGFMSIKWYYGTMILRPERIALCKTVAEL